MRPFLVNPHSLDHYIAGDGQKLTTLIRIWAETYLRQCGAKDFSINDVSWRPDGGIDGIINDTNLSDPFSWFESKTVMQFKAGTTRHSDAKNELLREAQDGSPRIRDKIADGYRLVWFIGKTLTDSDRTSFEDALHAAVLEIIESGPRPVVLDLNRISLLISSTPGIAMEVAANPNLFLTSDSALQGTPHSQLPHFVPGSAFEDLRLDIARFFLGGPDTAALKYISGEPGIGKTRSILEAVESTPELQRSVCYFPDPTKLNDFLDLAKQHKWKASVIVDEFIGDSFSHSRVTESNIPSGIKILLIGHAYLTNRSAPRVTNRLEPLTGEEVKRALAATFIELPDFRLIEATQMSGGNIRLARLICDYIKRNPTAEGMDANALARIVDEELIKMPDGKDSLKRLSLIPNLLADEVDDFCEMVDIDSSDFRNACRRISGSSALIQFNDHVIYVGSPVIAQYALIRFWVDDRELVTHILKNPGRFGDRVLLAINRLPPCPEKEEMLSFFYLPTTNLNLFDLQEEKTGRRFLTLLTADPETYLPILHQMTMAARGNLHLFPYDSNNVGRRDIIWKLRDLAQFSDYFEMSQEIIYAFAREDTASAYSWKADEVWAGWFHAYFDHTAYPYDKRLDQLEKMAKEGDDFDRKLVLKAISDPFPHTGMNIPSSRVGGRVAPPELNFINGANIKLAADRIPSIVGVLLSSDDEFIRVRTSEIVLGYRFSWLGHNVFVQYVRMIQDPNFPKDQMRKLISDTRHYQSLKGRVDLPEAEQQESVWMHKQHGRLLDIIDIKDPIVDLIEASEVSSWHAEQHDSPLHQKLKDLAKECISDSSLFTQSLEILGDPNKYGGAALGKFIGEHLSDTQFSEALAKVEILELSGYTHALIRTAAANSESRIEQLQELANRCETGKPRLSLAIYQMLGDETYFSEATRMLTSTEVSSRLFGSIFLRSKEELTEAHWSYISAMVGRVTKGDKECTTVLLGIVGELERTQVDDERGYDAGMIILQTVEPTDQNHGHATWSEIASWLYSKYPDEVLKLAASKPQGQYSEATNALAEIAKFDGESVLDSLQQKLLNPLKPPYLLNGGLQNIVKNVPSDIFREWISKQTPELLSNLAGHLPRPYFSEGIAIVPPSTRFFWEVCTPDLGEPYSKARSNFGARTFDTGVFTGYGLELFSERVKLGKALLSDPNETIRSWAEQFVQESQHMYDEGVRRKEISKASDETGNW